MRLRPFSALRPAPGLAAAVASPPYDVVTRAEATEFAKGNPASFLHVVRSDIDVPEGVAPDHPRVYAQARESLERLVREGTLLREQEPALYLYRLILDGHAQVGVVGCAHVDDYADGVIKTHETTRPDNEDDRTRHILTLEAHAEPVLLAHRGQALVDRLAATGMQAPPLYDFTASGRVRHTVWKVEDPGSCVAAFGEVPAAYIGDGHHRSASARRAALEHRSAGAGPRADDEADWFPVALFPAAQLRILAYNRLITDLGGRTTEEVLSKLAKAGRLTSTDDPLPAHPASFGIYLEGRWRLLELEAPSIDHADLLGSLDVTLLHERVLEPILGIGDPRTDKRIDFAGGLHGPATLAARVDSGHAAMAMVLYPTSMAQLMAVSDAGRMMPPKSTWFEPKLASGLFVHTFG
jgi:uncharacterized protein (DUF1015 family)